MANIAQTVNVLQAMLLTDEATGELVRTPTFHVFAMNTGHHDAQAVDVSFVDDVPTQAVDDGEIALVSGSASVKGDTALVSLSNLDSSRAASVVLDLRGRAVVDVSALLLTAPELASHNTASAPDTVVPVDHDGVGHHDRGLQVELPAHSYVTLSLALG